MSANDTGSGSNCTYTLLYTPEETMAGQIEEKLGLS